MEIGELLAIFMLTKLIAPLTWGWLADYFHNRLFLIRLATVFTVFSFLGIYFHYGYWWIAIVMFTFGFFWHASLPQYEAMTLNHLGSKTSRYSLIRLWGSVGFIIMVVSLPAFIADEKIVQLPHYLLLLFIVLALTAWVVGDKPYNVKIAKISAKQSFLTPIFLAFLVVCVLQAMSHGAYYTFFSIYLEDYGYSRTEAGLLWALGVSSEVALFLVFTYLMRYFSMYHLFTGVMFLTAVRWLLLGFYVDTLWLLVLSQLLHAASFGLFHAAAIHLVHLWFPSALQGRGQALYAALNFGLGGAIGSFLSGYLWDNVAPHTTFLVMAFCALLGGCVAWLFVHERHENERQR